MIFHVDKMQEDDGEEGYVNEDLGPPQTMSSMKEEGKNTDDNKEDGCVNDDMGSPEKVCMNINNGTDKTHSYVLIMKLAYFCKLQIKEVAIIKDEVVTNDVEVTQKIGETVEDGGVGEGLSEVN